MTTTTGPVNVDRALSRSAGILLPVIITPAAWELSVRWTKEDAKETGAVDQDETGRLWDVLTMAAGAARRAGANAVEASFTVFRVPRGVPYLGDSDDDELADMYRAHMVQPLTVIVGGTPTTVTISLDEE
jgi:hypothetical protein